MPYMIAGGVGELSSLPLRFPPETSFDRVRSSPVWWLGIVGGYYVFNPSFQELSGKGPAPGPIKDGRSQSVQEDRHDDGYVGSSSFGRNGYEELI